MFEGIVPKLIAWHGFLEEIKKPERCEQESCAWIFADLTKYVWHIIEVKNVGLKGRSLFSSFAPDKKDFARVKRIAKKYKWTKIGNVHTHVVIGDSLDECKNQLRPSETDLKYACKFNDIVRAIIVIQYPKIGEKGILYNMVWFDQYGNILG